MDSAGIAHRPYPKIPTRLAEGPGAGPDWVATEKIHGAQLVLGCDGRSVQVGKRKAWLADDEPFFGWQLLRGALVRAALDAFAFLRASAVTDYAPATVYVYGELFGGAYPHPETEALPGLSPVQTGIWYAPGLAFAAFDVLVCRGAAPEHSDPPEPEFLSRTELEAVAEHAGLRTVPVLGRGTRRQLEALPVRYPTTVPEQLGLPALPDNVAEGYVLVPDRRLPAKARPVVKHKIPEFDDLRFDASVPFDPNRHLELDALERWTGALVNPMRLASARSKVGEDPEVVVEEALLDVFIDLEAIFPRRMAGLRPDEEATLRRGVEARLRELIAAAP